MKATLGAVAGGAIETQQEKQFHNDRAYPGSPGSQISQRITSRSAVFDIQWDSLLISRIVSNDPGKGCALACAAQVK